MTYVHVLIAECLSVRLLILQCRLFLVGRVWRVHKHLSCLGLRFQSSSLCKFCMEWKWGQRGKQSEWWQSEAKDSNGEVTLCHCGARQRLRHLTKLSWTLHSSVFDHTYLRIAWNPSVATLLPPSPPPLIGRDILKIASLHVAVPQTLIIIVTFIISTSGVFGASTCACVHAPTWTLINVWTRSYMKMHKCGRNYSVQVGTCCSVAIGSVA